MYLNTENPALICLSGAAIHVSEYKFPVVLSIQTGTNMHIEKVQ